MATIDERATKMNELHARITEARIAIHHALARNDQVPLLPGAQDAHRALVEADRLLNNVVAGLPWRTTTN